MYYCLNNKEISVIIDQSLNNVKIEEDYLQKLYSDAENWLCNLGELNYSFSQYLEQNRDIGKSRDQLIKCLYSLEDKIYLTIHEVDYDLVEFMIRNLPHPSLSLEENLIDLQSNIVNREYGKALRY